MSDYHILAKAIDNKTCTVVVHLAVPNLNNLAGVNYRTAIEQRQTVGGAVITSAVPDHETDFAADDASLKNGALYEKVISFRFSSKTLTNVARRNQMRDHVTQMKLDIEDENSDLYKEILEPVNWWGYHQDIT